MDDTEPINPNDDVKVRSTAFYLAVGCLLAMRCVAGPATSATPGTVPGSPVSDAVIYPVPAGVAPSGLYEVEINGHPAFVYPCRVGDIYDAKGNARPDPPETTTAQPAAFCHFDMAGSVDIKIRTKGTLTLKSAQVRPLNRGIQPRIENACITFRISQPGQYSVELNGSAQTPLLIFANPPEIGAPQPNDPNVLYFGPGEHVIGWMSVKSGQTVYLAGGAVVYGHLIIGNGDGVRIIGRGILDSSRSPRKGERITSNEFGRCDVQMHIGHSKNVLVEGICLIDSPAWTIHVVESRDVTIRNVKIITWRENGDGVDVNNSERVRVESSFLRTWDDSLVVKATLGRPRTGKPKSRSDKWTPQDLPLYPPGLTRDIVFQDCVIWLDRAHALEIGLETSGTEIAGITYRNIDIIHDNDVAAIDIGNGDRAHVHGIRYDDIRIEDSRSDMLIRLYSGHCYTSIDDQMGLDYGPIDDVVFSNIRVSGSAKPRIVLEGQSIDPAFQQPKVHDVLFKTFEVDGKTAAASDVTLERKGLVGATHFNE